MARFVKKAQTVPMKYMFEMALHQIELHVPYEVQVILVLKRGSKRLETQKVVKVGSGQPIANFNDEKLTMLCTVHKDKTTKKLQDRVGNLIVQIKKDDKVKSVGIVKVNLVDYIDQQNGIRTQLPLEKCPDKNAKVDFTVRSVLVSSSVNGTETISMASEAMSVDSGPESEFDFGDMDSAAGARKSRQRGASRGPDRNILVQLQTEQISHQLKEGRPPLQVPSLPTNQPRQTMEEAKKSNTGVHLTNPAAKTNFLNKMAAKRQDNLTSDSKLPEISSSSAMAPIVQQQTSSVSGTSSGFQSSHVKSIKRVKLNSQGSVEPTSQSLSSAHSTAKSTQQTQESSSPSQSSTQNQVSSSNPVVKRMIVKAPVTMLKQGNTNAVNGASSTLMKGGEIKESNWKADEVTPRSLKTGNTLPSQSKLTADQRNIMLAKIKGQASTNVTNLKDQLNEAEQKASSLETEKKNLSEQLALLKEEHSQEGDDYKIQMQSMLSAKQQAQDKLSCIEDELTRCSKEKDKHKLLANQHLSMIESLKEQVRAETDLTSTLQSKSNVTLQQHAQELKKLKQEAASEKALLENDKNELEQRAQEEAIKARESQSKVEQLVAQLELTNQKVDRLNLESSSEKSSIEMRLKNQISELESQLQQSSRLNHQVKQQATTLQSQLKEVQQECNASKMDADRARLNVQESDNLIESLQQQVRSEQQDNLQAQTDFKSAESGLRDQLAAAVNRKEQLDADMKNAAKQMKDKERKLGSLENKLKDMEDEQLILIEQHQDQIKSKQAIFQHQLDDSKRRQIELEEKLGSTKQQMETLRLQSEAPTQDSTKNAKASNHNSNQVANPKTESEEVLQLHEQLTEMQSQMIQMENQNMETVALLKQENRKQAKQLKESEKVQGGSQPGASGASGKAGAVSQRDVAKLTVENEMLTAQVTQLTQQLETNQGNKSDGSQNNEQNGEEVEALSEELQNMQMENQDLNQQLEEIGLEYRTIEQQLIEAKLQAATLDMEADQLSVEMTQKNELLKKFSTKCTKLEIEIVQMQAMQGHTDESVGDEGENSDRGAAAAQNHLQTPQSAATVTSQKKTVSNKLKSFFTNKFKKSSKTNDASKSAAAQEGNSSRNSTGAATSEPIGIQDQEQAQQ